MTRLWPEGIRVVGLTGGIASGKSTVSAMLRGQGAQVIDADALAREVVAQGTPGLAEIAQRWPEVIAPGGGLDRPKLAKIVFADAAQREDLNAIVHPRVQAALFERIEALAKAGERLAIYDVPLLVENGLQAILDGVIVVSAPREQQLVRLLQRDGLSTGEAEARLAAQLPLSEKLKVATWVVDNGGSLEETRRQVDALWKYLSALPPL